MEIPNSDIASGSWNRLINATSKASISLPIESTQDPACALYAKLGVGMPFYELHLYRAASVSDSPELTWMGTLTDVSIEPGNILTLDAEDFSWWLQNRVLPSSSYPSGTDVVTMAQAYVSAALTVNNPPQITLNTEPSLITGKKDVQDSDRSKALETVTDVLRSVIYWTQAFREFRINVNGKIPWVFTDDDLNERPELRWSVDDFATEVIPRSSSGVLASVGGIDTTRFGGCPILVQRTLDVNAEDEGDAASFATKRYTEMQSTGPSIDALRSSISPTSGVTIEELWPGLQAEVLFEGYGAPINRLLFITQVEAAWSEDGEEVRIELSPTVGDPNDPRVAAV